MNQFVSLTGLGNGDSLGGSVDCRPSRILSGGYTLDTERPGDLDKLIPIANYPSDPQTWTVVIRASAAVQRTTLSVYGICD